MEGIPRLGENLTGHLASRVSAVGACFSSWLICNDQVEWKP